MRRPGLAWTVFSAALALSLGVMLFFTVKMLQFERSTSMAQSEAELEETVRLALWRMDSAAALLLQDKSDQQSLASNSNAQMPQQISNERRLDPSFQQQMSEQELQERKAFKALPQGDWRKIEPVLLDRISDILPGASLEEAGPSDNSTDTRRLATIPARLVVPASALPPADLPWDTPLRISLMIAWLAAAVAAAAVAKMLAATLSLSERRGAFASAVTHELRTPLTTFKMYAEMLAGGMVDDPAARRQYLDTLVAEADRLAHLIENVLAYSRLENRTFPKRSVSLSLEQLIQGSLPALNRRVRQAGLALRVRIDDGETNCRTEPVAVQQILLNLVDNACKYGRTDVALTARRDGDGIEIGVSDAGPGVAAEPARRLFTAFSKSRTDTVPGIGLGLFLSRRLARDLGGELAQGEAPKGATFVLTLPT